MTTSGTLELGSINTTLIGDLLTGSVKLLDDLINNPSLLSALEPDLGQSLDEVYTKLNASREAISGLVNSLTNGASVDTITQPLQTVQDTLTELDSFLTSNATSVTALKDVLNALNSDLGKLAGSTTQGLTTEDALAVLSPIAEDLGTLDSTLSEGLDIDEPVGDILDAVLGNSPLLDSIVNDLGELAEPLGQAIAPLVSNLETVVDHLSNGVTSPQDLADGLNAIIDGLQGIVDSLAGNTSDNVNALVDGVQDLIGDLSNTVADALDGTVPLTSEIIRVLAPVAEDLTNIADHLTGNGTGSGDPNKHIFDGSESNETIKTTAKQDIFDMKGGRDVVISTIDNLKQVDSLTGGEGIDTLVLQQGGKKDVLRLRVATTSDPNNLISSELPENTVISGFEIFNGRAFKGRAIIKGNSDSDELHGGQGKDKFSGQKGHDFMSGNNGKDHLNGSSGNDTILGGNATDVLIAGEGDDLLTGGRGKDKIKTGKGKDEITFGSLKDRGDRLIDFQSGKDTLVFKGSSFSKDLQKGELKKSQLMLDGKAPAKGACFMYNQDKGTLLFDADGTGNTKSVLVAKLVNEVALSASDITII